MSVWTRYKYEKTRLDSSFQLTNRQQGQTQAQAQQGESRINDNDKKKKKVVLNIGVRRSQITRQLREQMAADGNDDDNNEENDENINENLEEEGESRSGSSSSLSSSTQSKNSVLNKKNQKKKKSAENESKLPSSFIRHSKKEIFCKQCRNGGSPLEDPKAGRIVCTQCGLVLEVGYISEQSEWRNFADSDKSGPDPNRVGSAGHYLLNDAGDLSTKIDDGYLKNLQQSTTNSNVSTQLYSAIRRFETVGRGLGLNKDTQNCSGEIFKDLSESNELRQKTSKTKQAISMYLACKMCNHPRPFKEICREFNVDHKTVRKLHSEIQRLEAAKKLNLAKHRQNIISQVRSHNKDPRQSTIEVYALRYASKLQCEKKMNKYLKKIVQNSEKLFSNRQPTSLAAACVFLACSVQQDVKKRRSYKEVAAATGVGVSTIQNVYRSDLFPKRIKLVPSEYADKIQLKNLSLQ